MKNVLVKCDGFGPSGSNFYNDVVDINMHNSPTNVRKDINLINYHHFSYNNNRFDDLLCIATSIYISDTRVSRGGITDIECKTWKRNFDHHIPVFDFDFWTNPEIIKLLSNLLHYLTGDSHTFHFHNKPHSNLAYQDSFNFSDNKDTFNDKYKVVLFSGGLDSLLAVINVLKDDYKPFLVSHRPAPVLAARQTELITELKKEFRLKTLPHASAWITNYNRTFAKERTQRSRSFLFLSLASVLAKYTDSSEIIIADNGVVTLNLPPSPSMGWTLLSRSTHPQVLYLFEILLSRINDNNLININNPLLYSNKREVLNKIANSTANGNSLISHSYSCSHHERMTKDQPHCGVCSQCIDRRFATIAANLVDYDDPDKYVVDIFKDNIVKEQDIYQIENYMRLSKTLDDISSPEDLLEKYPSLYDCFEGVTNIPVFVKRIFGTLKRHANNYGIVVEKQVQLHSTSIRKGLIGKNSIINLAINGISNIHNSFIDKITSTLQKSLPIIFQSHTPKNEHEVQNAMEGLLVNQDLLRELPLLPYASVNTKPDFTHYDKDHPPLFIEVKYPKKRDRLNRVITEISSRILIYRDQHADVLFVIYDPIRTIIDDDKFKEQFIKHDGIYVSIIR